MSHQRSTISASNGHGRPDAGVPAARPAVLVCYRPGVTGETARTVHVVSLPTDEPSDVVSTACGAALLLDDIETVNPGEGMPCMVCFVDHVTATTPAEEPLQDGADAELAVGGTHYQEWGWPVVLHRNQVQLSLHREVSAQAVRVPLGIKVAEILARRRCVPAVLAHPYMPEHYILLTGEPRRQDR